MDNPITFRAVRVIRSNFIVPQRVTLTVSQLKQSILFSNAWEKLEVFYIGNVFCKASRNYATVRIRFRSNFYVLIICRVTSRLLPTLTHLERTCNHPCLFIPGVNSRLFKTLSAQLKATMPEALDLSAQSRQLVKMPAQSSSSTYPDPDSD